MILVATLEEAMHTIGQSLLAPVIILITALMIVTVAKLGGFITECIVERRRFVADIPRLLKEINRQDIENAGELIDGSGLLKSQRHALTELLQNRAMPKALLVALAERLLADEENRYLKSLELPEMICKVGPMLGLVGTLVPLGPGLQALAQGDVAALSKSLTIAFDATTCGLACAGIGYVLVIIRRRWYSHYISQLESIMETILEKVHPEEAAALGSAGDTALALALALDLDLDEKKRLKGAGADA